MLKKVKTRQKQQTETSHTSTNTAQHTAMHFPMESPIQTPFVLQPYPNPLVPTNHLNEVDTVISLELIISQQKTKNIRKISAESSVENIKRRLSINEQFDIPSTSQLKETNFEKPSEHSKRVSIGTLRAHSNTQFSDITVCEILDDESSTNANQEEPVPIISMPDEDTDNKRKKKDII